MAPPEKQYKRLYPRRKASVSCQVKWRDDQVFGNSMNVSLGGLAIMLYRPIEQGGEVVEVRIPEGEGIVLHARPVHKESLTKGTVIGFEIERIENGKQEWQRICYIPSW